MGRKLGAVPPLWGGELSPHVAQCGLDRDPPPCQVLSWSIQTFGHNRHGPKKFFGGSVPFWGGELSPHVTQCHLGRGLPPYLVASWSMQPFCNNRYGTKIEGLCPFQGWGPGPPSNAIWPRPKPTCLLSFILIHPTVWRQYTNVTDGTDIQDRQQFDSIGRTVYKRSSKNDMT